MGACVGDECGCYVQLTDEELGTVVTDVLLRCDPVKARFVCRFEPGWQSSREALIRIAHLFRVPGDTTVERGDSLAGWEHLDA